MRDPGGRTGNAHASAHRDCPKTLLPVRGRPFAYHQLHWLAAQGITEVVYSIGHQGEMIRRYWDAGTVAGSVDCAMSMKASGYAGPAAHCALAREQGVLDDRFFVIYGDSFLPVEFAPIWQAFQASGLPALMTVLRNGGRWDRSNAIYEDGRVLLYNKAGRPGHGIY